MQKLKISDLTKVVQTLLESGAKDTPAKIAKLLISTKQTKSWPAVLRNLEHSNFEHNGTLRAVVTSPFELSTESMSQLKSIVAKNFGSKEGSVSIESVTDKSLLSGVRIEALSRQLDVSGKQQLKSLKSALIA
jgi:F0F1-type ATP synthase delta subunit